MTLPSDIKVTSEILWQGALIFALIDLGFVSLLAWRIKRTRFRQLKWALVIATAVFWSLLWAWVLDWGWGPVYSYVFPDWIRAWLPLLQGLHFAVTGLVFCSSSCSTGASSSALLGYCGAAGNGQRV
jgi:hypothetical protein